MEEKGWQEELGLETFKGDDIIKARKIEDFTHGKWQELNKKEDDKRTSEDRGDTETNSKL